MKRLRILLSVDLPLLTVLNKSIIKWIGLNGHASAHKANIVTHFELPSETLKVNSLNQQIKEFFNPLQKKCTLFSCPLQHVFKLFWPPHVSTTLLLLNQKWLTPKRPPRIAVHPSNNQPPFHHLRYALVKNFNCTNISHQIETHLNVSKA